MKKDESLRCFPRGPSTLSDECNIDEGPDFNAFCSVTCSYLGLWSLQLSLNLMGSLFLYAEKALMNSSLRILKSVMDLEKNYTYHFMAFPFNVVGNILHIREYKAIAFRYDIIWHKWSEYTLKYFTLGCVNLFGGDSYARALERESPP
ncbi:hypothetical protein TB1_006938 [Malus domestica]